MGAEEGTHAGADPEQASQVDVAVASRKSVGQAVKEIGVTDHTCYRWRREYGGLQAVSGTGTGFGPELAGIGGQARVFDAWWYVARTLTLFEGTLGSGL